jgi:hypothetical protein
VLIGALLAALAWLSYRDPGSAAISNVDHTTVFTAWLQRRYSPRRDFEAVGLGAIVPVDKAPELLRQCSRSSINPIEGYWRPTANLVREMETRLAVELRTEPRLEALDSYTGQYAGVVSGGRQLIYGSFVSSALAADEWRRSVVILCGGGPAAFGVTFDIATRTFGELQINVPR